MTTLHPPTKLTVEMFFDALSSRIDEARLSGIAGASLLESEEVSEEDMQALLSRSHRCPKASSGVIARTRDSG